MKKSGISYSEECKKETEARFKESLYHIFPDGIPDGSILFHLNATIYLLNEGDIEGTISFYDKNGQKLEIPLSAFGVRTPYKNKGLHQLLAVSERGNEYKNGIPILIKQEQASLIKTMKINWNITSPTNSITMTELCELTFECVAGERNIYELCTKIRSVFDPERAERSYEKDAEYLEQYDNYCFCYTRCPLPKWDSRKVVRFPLTKEMLERKFSYRERLQQVTDIWEELGLHLFYPRVYQTGELVPIEDRLSDEQMIESLVLDNIDKAMYLKGLKQGRYQFVLSKRTAHLLPEKAPYESFLYS